MSLTRTLYRRWQQLVHEAAKFGVVGAACAVVDIGLFNLLIFAADLQPVRSKVISVAVAATCAYLGNRYWSFRHRQRTGLRRELPIFALLNLIGLVIASGVLYVSHYVLDFTSKLADNIAANVVGLGLGTLFRFWSYRRFVFLAVRAGDEVAPIGATEHAALDSIRLDPDIDVRETSSSRV